MTSSALSADRLDAVMDVEEINKRVNKAGDEHFAPDHFHLVCMSLKSRMRWALMNDIITQEEHDAVKNSTSEYRWEYAE